MFELPEPGPDILWYIAASEPAEHSPCVTYPHTIFASTEQSCMTRANYTAMMYREVLQDLIHIILSSCCWGLASVAAAQHKQRKGGQARRCQAIFFQGVCHIPVLQVFLSDRVVTAVCTT